MKPRKPTKKKQPVRNRKYRNGSSRGKVLLILVPVLLIAVLMVDVVRYRKTGQAWFSGLHQALELGSSPKGPSPADLVSTLENLSPQNFHLNVGQERTLVSIPASAPQFYIQALERWPHEQETRQDKLVFGYPDLPNQVGKRAKSEPLKNHQKGRDPENPAQPEAKPLVSTNTTEPAPQAQPWPRPANEPKRPALAIVIDDVGQSLDLVPDFLALKVPLTYAIIPFLPESESSAKKIHASGMPVILHLPMEPLNYPENDPGKGAILTSHGKREIQKRTQKAMDAIPHLEGFNNHMGSKATASSQVMAWVMETAEKRNLYYLDSRTNADTVGFIEARKAGIPTLQRDTFLDDTDEVEAVRRQLFKAAARAKREGFSVAIGHIKPNTLKALRETLPELERQGIKLVTLSELMKS